METINKPYVKKYDSKGLLLNPIGTGYFNFNPNRRKRREHLSNKSFRGNQKGRSLIVVNNGVGSAKYERLFQNVVNKLGVVVNVIKHYITK